MLELIQRCTDEVSRDFQRCLDLCRGVQLGVQSVQMSVGLEAFKGLYQTSLMCSGFQRCQVVPRSVHMYLDKGVYNYVPGQRCPD